MSMTFTTRCVIAGIGGYTHSRPNMNLHCKQTMYMCVCARVVLLCTILTFDGALGGYHAHGAV